MHEPCDVCQPTPVADAKAATTSGDAGPPPIRAVAWIALSTTATPGEPALRLTIQDADPAYIDERAGDVLYVHLRALENATGFRRGNLERVVALYRAADAEPPAARAGLGLLVLQRAYFLCEDLGALLFALGRAPEKPGLTSYRLEDLDELFRRAVRGELDLSRHFRMATPVILAEEPGMDTATVEAFTALLDLTCERVSQKLRYVGAWWATWSRVGKKTMHGLGFMAGEYAVTAEAGVIASLLPPGLPSPVTVALDSTTDHASGSVNTEVQPLAFTPLEVGRHQLVGANASDLLLILAAGWLHGLQTNHKCTVPLRYVDELSAKHQALVQRAKDAKNSDAVRQRGTRP